MMQLDGLRREIFEKRYAMADEKDWGQLADRVASVISRVEINGAADEWKRKFKKSLGDGDFMPGGRILFGAGRNQFNMLNCYRLHPSDTAASIGKMIQDTYLISCGGGGIGFNFSDIRPKGDNIQTIKYSAPGAVSVMQMVNEIGHHVKSGKNRRTALIAILNVTHPDLLEFLHVKLNLNELTNFNISIGITNEFIEAVRTNAPWSFRFQGREYKVYNLRRGEEPQGDPEITKAADIIQVVALSPEDAVGRAMMHYRVSQDDEFTCLGEANLRARDIWDMMVQNSWASGDPGIYNIDLANSYTNVSYFESLESPNPCGEIPLPPYGNCCLGHVNLYNMFDPKTGDVDWRKLARTVRVGVRFLDNVLSSNHYPVSECRDVGERSRRIGLGVTGLHYLLLLLGHRYGSEECLEFLERLFGTLRNEAYKASIDLAKEKGAFPAFDAEKFKKEEFFKTLPKRLQTGILEHGIRNAVMLTIAPCGTNSMVLGVSSGIEPIFAPVYRRRFRDGNIWREEIVADSLFAEHYATGKDLSHFVGAYDISVEEHIRVQATIQQFIDSSISKTTNLPNDYDASDLGDVILKYADSVKGFTIYRQGSKGEEPLTPIDISDADKLRQAMADAGVDVHSIEACRGGVCEI